MIPREHMRNTLVDLVHDNKLQLRHSTTQKLLDKTVAMSLEEDYVEVGFALSLINGLAAMGPSAMEVTIAAILKSATKLDVQGFCDRNLPEAN